MFHWNFLKETKRFKKENWAFNLLMGRQTAHHQQRGARGHLCDRSARTGARDPDCLQRDEAGVGP